MSISWELGATCGGVCTKSAWYDGAPKHLSESTAACEVFEPERERERERERGGAEVGNGEGERKGGSNFRVFCMDFFELLARRLNAGLSCS